MWKLNEVSDREVPNTFTHSTTAAAEPEDLHMKKGHTRVKRAFCYPFPEGGNAGTQIGAERGAG